MLSVLTHKTFAPLFAAQVVALLGTGLLTVALGLLAYDLAPARAAGVLGIAYTIKMVAYVGLSPVMAALVARLPRKPVLIFADMIRAAVALFLPFITEIWQIYLAVFLLQTASATFTPAFQATIPDVLPDEGQYARALSLSRMAYDLENLVSPALAGLLLTVMSYHWLFGGTVLGFAASALLVALTALPAIRARKDRPFAERLTRGVRIYLATPRLRGLLALTLGAAAASAFVIVNTVVIVRRSYGGSETDVALILAAYGTGSMIAALALPRLLDRTGDRPVMLAGAIALTFLMPAMALSFTPGPPVWALAMAGWAALGAAGAAVLTPSGRLLRRSAHEEDRAAVFTAQFALSHVCWLVTYPLAGATMTAFGAAASLVALALCALAGLVAALLFWPKEVVTLPHAHPDLPADHPHLRGAAHKRHAHPFVIDDEHRAWPTHG